VAAAVEGLSDEQMKFKPAAERWSVLETLEHIAKSEDFIYRRVIARMKQPPEPMTDRDHAGIDEMILMRLPVSTRKIQAPPALAPEGAATPAETLHRFLEYRARSIAFAESAQNLRDYAFESPFGTKLDGYQWLLFNAAHSERHTRQILELKSDPGFPQI
jgi:hypothetical protein